MRAQELGRPPVRCPRMEPEHPSFPPWHHINTMYLFDLWFGRPDGYCVSNWAGIVAENRAPEEWGKARYWCSHERNYIRLEKDGPRTGVGPGDK